MKQFLFVASAVVVLGMMSNGASAEPVNCWPEHTLHRVVSCNTDGKIVADRVERVREKPPQCEGEYCGCPHEYPPVEISRVSLSAGVGAEGANRQRRGAGEK